MSALLEAFSESPIFANPESTLQIKLPIFEGPLDLLLHLIRKKELNIYEVNLCELTASYLQYIELMQSVNLDLAGEFLEIAATLIWIKSKHLLPKVKVEDDSLEEPADPEEQLRKQLIEYQKYKHAAFVLSSRDLLGRDIFARPELIEEATPEEAEEEPVFEELSLYALVAAFRRAMENQPKIRTHIVEIEKYRIEDRIEDLLRLFTFKARLEFDDLFSPEHPKGLIVITFMAILEMTKYKLIRVMQSELFGPITCQVHEDFPDNRDKWYHQQIELLAPTQPNA